MWAWVGGSLIGRAIPKTNGVSKALTTGYPSCKTLNVGLSVHLSETATVNGNHPIHPLPQASLVKGFVLWVNSTKECSQCQELR